MPATQAPQNRRSGDTFAVKWDVFDSLAEAHGATTEAQKAGLGGVHRVTLHRYRTGELEPSPAFIMKAAGRLGVRVEALIPRSAA
jgi:transcriptional regulator with XRE-family HTH domain